MENMVVRLIDALIRMGAEVIALGLQKIGRQLFAAVPVEKCERGRKRRERNSQHDCLRYNSSPRRLTTVDDRFEIIVQQQVGKIGIFIKRGFDFFKEYTPDDASAAPQIGDAAEIKLPAVFFLSLAHAHEPLGIRYDF